MLTRYLCCSIAHQLYDSSTHFILELLQNLDDTEYDKGMNPSVKFILHGEFLHVRSNQVGFSKDDVEAICAVGSSTKKAKTGTGTNSSIGEKGIGFKSLFRVADFVWLSSRGYHLEWDRNRMFGMIAPEWWDDWPDPANPEMSGQTCFCMRIPEAQDRQDISKDLKKFEPGLLLFLNKLNCVELEVVEASGTKPWNRIIRHTETGDKEYKKGFCTCTLEDGQSTFDYLKTEYYAEGLPQEARRPGCRKTKLVLAFPAPPAALGADGGGHLPLGVSHSQSRPPASQNVYAGLPICPHGLQVIIPPQRTQRPCSSRNIP